MPGIRCGGGSSFDALSTGTSDGNASNRPGAGLPENDHVAVGGPEAEMTILAVLKHPLARLVTVTS